MSTTIRVSEATRQRAAAIAAATGRQLQAVVEDALVRYERALFWEAFEDRFARLAEDEQGWSEVVIERRGEEGALHDGVVDEPATR